MIGMRLSLAEERLKELYIEASENDTCVGKYFASLISNVIDSDDKKSILDGTASDDKSIDELLAFNHSLYDEISEEHYAYSYANPSYACECLGEDYGPVLSAVFAEIVGMIPLYFDKNVSQILIRKELVIQLWLLFENNDWKPDIKAIIEIITSFEYDYLDEFLEERIKTHVVAGCSIADRIIETANLTEIDYLFEYGDYISDNEIELSRYMAKLPQETIERIAETYTEGYRLGFVTTGKDLSIKETVDVRYPIGFERVVRRAVELFEDMGLKPTYRRPEHSFFLGRSLVKVGVETTIPNKQFECDHEKDRALIWSKKYLERKLEAYRNAFEKYREDAYKHAGPAVIESFGESPFTPIDKKCVIKPDANMQKLMSEYAVRASEIVNAYIKGEERSFTIISFPSPAIGENFSEIFDETIRINTLDYMMYRDMQQKLIDTLDKSRYVKVSGTNGNDTDLTVALWHLNNPERETIFENCVADVNIPVGEVFTSPVLEGTNGLLHVKYVFLNGRPYNNLKLWFKDGMIDKYSCDNYDDNGKNLEYIKEHILFNHETLPLGEFAIGTNTVAYSVIKRLGLEAVMPILITEKTGPHFAVGDTCYSHEEELQSFNPDGKAIVARENSVSALRSTDPLKAYFNCHTDITIPYDELGELKCVDEDGTEYVILKDGRFSGEGLEVLNGPLDELV